MTFTAEQLASILKGTVIGNPEVTVCNFSKIEEGQPGTLSFLSNPKYTEYIYTTKSSIVLVNKDFKADKAITATLIKVEDAYKSLAILLSLVEQNKEKKTGIDPLAFISKTATVGKNVYIGPFAFIGENVVIGNDSSIYPHTFLGDNVEIANNTLLFSGVKIYENCLIGSNCIIHAGTVIGSDGFGFAPNASGGYDKIAQIGNVIIEDNVEIGANCAIDCATMGSSIIRKGSKLDNLVHLAHNVEIGENSAIAGQVGIAGSTKIGRNCVFAGQVGVAGHIIVADGSTFGAKSGVPSSIKKENEIWMGSPVQEIKGFRRSAIAHKNLPELHHTIIEMQNEIERLKKLIEKKHTND
jgi:UDP-3-O-[3-hydroxymyristoyl] glucosamine N-acyltransferase